MNEKDAIWLIMIGAILFLMSYSMLGMSIISYAQTVVKTDLSIFQIMGIAFIIAGIILWWKEHEG
jgi:putative Ca2+/H+ antiporter (TMEM165/GDT1 family)